MKIHALSTVLTVATLATSAANGAAITSMTIQDVTGDTISGAFRFAPINFATYAGTNNFNSNGEAVSRIQGGEATDGAQLPGAGTDGGILFGQVQDVNAITPGFTFFTPFQPLTLSPPSGSVDWNAANSRFELTITSLDWAGLYNSSLLFPLSPDATPSEACTVNEVQSGGICVRFLEQISANQFNYQIRWNHQITLADDPSGGTFTSFNARWALEGVITTVPVPAAAWLFASGLFGLMGVARIKAHTR